MYTIKQYSPENAAVWDDFVSKSKNGTFLFYRDFMEYHADRFEDFSLLIYKGEKLTALLPAHKNADEVFSHRGLTYGGLILNPKIHLADVVVLFSKLLEYLKKLNFSKLHIKTIPFIYHKVPSQEMEYALFQANAKLVRRDSVSVIENAAALKFGESRKQAIRSALKNNLRIEEDNNFKDFWNIILIPNLQRRHNATPVHSLEEIELLKKRFPKNIRHFNVYENETLIAGTTIFVTDTVAKSQYISADENRNQSGSLDMLYSYLITDVFKNMKFFNFGPSNLDNGRVLQQSISFWKESFGARTIVHDFYEVETANYVLLENVLI